MKVITFSLTFPAKHPKAGQPTYFVEKIWKGLWDREKSSQHPAYPQWQQYDQAFPCSGDEKESIHLHQPKHHTIRAGNRWKVGDQFSPRVWSGKPYRSKQVEFAPPITIVKTWRVKLVIKSGVFNIWIDGRPRRWDEIRHIFVNDGLDREDFLNWFNVHPKKKKQVFAGQILSWSDKINY